MSFTDGLGALEYTAGGRSALFPVWEITISHSPPGFTVRAAGSVKRGTLRALAESSTQTVTLIAANGTRVYSTLSTTSFAAAISGGANYVNIYQPFELVR